MTEDERKVITAMAEHDGVETEYGDECAFCIALLNVSEHEPACPVLLALKLVEDEG